MCPEDAFEVFYLELTGGLPMRCLSIALIAAASTIALTQMASAADLPRKAPVYVPPVPVADWSGVYVGLEGGYGWGHQNINAISPGDEFDFPDAYEYQFGPTPGEKFFSPDVSIGSVKQRGWLFGGFFGVQKQWGSWVLGLEGDIDGASTKGSSASSASEVFDVDVYTTDPKTWEVCKGCLTLNHSLSVDSKIDMLGSVRGKVGFVPAPDWLIYGTGGLAFAHIKTNFTDTESYTVKLPMLMDPIFSSFTGSSGTSMFGWAAGAGVDWKFWHDAGSAWILGVEYLHYGFPEHTITITDNAGRSGAFTATDNVDTVKGRISYLFSIH